MKYYYLVRIFLILSIVLLQNVLAVEDLPYQKNSSFEGRHFYVGFMQNEIAIDDETGLELQIYISSKENADIEVVIPGIPTVFKYSIKADSVLRVDIPEDIEVRKSEDAVQSLVEVTSNVPVTVYAFNSQSVSSDSYSVIPVSYWGKEYVALTMPCDQYAVPTNIPNLTPEDSAWFLYPRPGEFMIMAAFDSTDIEFAPTAITLNGKQIGRNYHITLNRGECYLVKSLETRIGANDLTGTFIRSQKPVGLLSGHVRTAIPQGLRSPWDSKDHIVEMLMPTSAWGRNFISVPFYVNDGGDYFRVVSLMSNTVVTYETTSGPKTINLNAPGSYADVRGLYDPAVWQSNQPVQIAQFMMHTGTYFDNQNYDPCMVILPPVEQYVSKIVFQTLGNSPRNPLQYIGHYTNLVVDDKALNTLRMDGRLLTNTPGVGFQPISGTQYFWAKINLNQGKHELNADSGRFSGIIYGRGLADSYGMILGSSLTNPFRNDSIPPKISVESECGKLEGMVWEVAFESATGIDFVKVITDSTFNYKWNIDKITDTSMVVNFTAEPVDFMKPGRIVIDFRDKNGNGKRYQYNYEGISLDRPANLSFKDVGWNDKSCVDFELKNLNTDTLYIGALTTTDPRIKITIFPPLPKFLAQNQFVTCHVCFEPGTDIKTLLDSLRLVINCGNAIFIPVTGNVIAPDLAASNLDFGNVKAGTTKCDSLWIANKGNIPVKIDYVTFIKYLSQFSIDTTSLFPITLEPGDSVKFLICFTPDTVADYSVKMTGINPFNLPNELQVTGRGVAPLIEPVVIDWGKRRIGTVNDSTFCLTNRGEVSAHVKFDHFVAFSDYPTDTNRDLLNNLETDINPGDTIRFPVSFQPLDTSVYLNRAVYTVDCVVHKPFQIELTGLGIIPSISTTNIIFDTLVIYNFKDTIAPVIHAGGNEQLTIDSIFILSGDTDDFEIDLRFEKNIIQQAGSAYQLPVRYYPKSSESHELLLGVVSDAMPSYERRLDTIRILGVAVPADTPNAVASITGPDPVFTCQNNVYKFSVVNTGNVRLELQKLDLELTGVDGDWHVNYQFPMEFLPGQTLEFEIEVTPLRNQSGSMKVTAQMNDTLKRIISVQIKPHTESIVLDDMPEFTGFPGDTSIFVISGIIPQKSVIPLDFKLSVEIPRENCLLVSEDGEIIFDDNGSKSIYPVKLSQSDQRIDISLPGGPVPIGGTPKWSLEFPLYVLLNSNRNPRINVYAESENCFNPAERLIPAEINEVCVFSYRNIKMVDGVTALNITPNPVNENLRMDVKLNSNETVNLYVFDQLGKKIELEKNLYLKKGSHSIIFEISSLPNGFYILSLQTEKNRINTIFIKSY